MFKKFLILTQCSAFLITRNIDAKIISSNQSKNFTFFNQKSLIFKKSKDQKLNFIFNKKLGTKKVLISLLSIMLFLNFYSRVKNIFQFPKTFEIESGLGSINASIQGQKVVMVEQPIDIKSRYTPYSKPFEIESNSHSVKVSSLSPCFLKQESSKPVLLQKIEEECSNPLEIFLEEEQITRCPTTQSQNLISGVLNQKTCDKKGVEIDITQNDLLTNIQMLELRKKFKNVFRYNFECQRLDKKEYADQEDQERISAIKRLAIQACDFFKEDENKDKIFSCEDNLKDSLAIENITLGNYLISFLSDSRIKIPSFSIIQMRMKILKKKLKMPEENQARFKKVEACTTIEEYFNLNEEEISYLSAKKILNFPSKKLYRRLHPSQLIYVNAVDRKFLSAEQLKHLEKEELFYAQSE